MEVISIEKSREILTGLVEASSQRFVSKVLDIHYNTVHRWLHGDAIPVIARLAIQWLRDSDEFDGRIAAVERIREAKSRAAEAVRWSG